MQKPSANHTQRSGVEYLAEAARYASLMASYTRFLHVQTKLQFPFERSLFEEPNWARARNVIDFGCGDGSYVSCLADAFPDKHYVAVDVNPSMIIHAAATSARANIEYRTSVDGAAEPAGFEFVLMRYVVMHLEDRLAVLDKLLERLTPEASILVIEPDDAAFSIRPPLPILDVAFDAVREVSHARNLKTALDADFNHFGFALVRSIDFVLSTAVASVDSEILKFLHAFSELGLQRELTLAEKAQMLDWYVCEGRYVQFGFNARLYKRLRVSNFG